MTDTLTFNRMSKRIKFKHQTIRRLRGQQNILRRAAQTLVNEAQKGDDDGEERPIHEKVVQDSRDNKRDEMRKFPTFTNDNLVFC